MSLIAAVLGRVLIALLFFFSGLSKLADPTPTAQALGAAHLPPTLAIPTGIFEIAAAVLLAIGLMTRLTSIALAVFVGLTIFFFHHDYVSAEGQATILNHLALIGGLLMVFAYGQMRGSYDWMRAQRKIHDAEIRAARAEGKAEGATSVPHTVVTREPAPAGTVVTDVDGDGVPEVRPKRRWF